jgi:hypothetical protein
MTGVLHVKGYAITFFLPRYIGERRDAARQINDSRVQAGSRSVDFFFFRQPAKYRFITGQRGTAGPGTNAVNYEAA